MTWLLVMLFFGAQAPVWEQAPAPVLVATQAWEQGVVQEPTVIHRPDGSYAMFYSGGWYDCTMGLATSPDGLHWRKHGRVLGDGAGGEAHNACHSSVSLINGRYFAWYTAAEHVTRGVGFRSPGLSWASSLDGRHWVAHGQAMPAGTGWDTQVVNTDVWVEGKAWLMLYETRGTDGLWRMSLARGSGPATWVKTRHLLTTLNLGGMYGGPSVQGTAGNYTLVFHASTTGANLPTDLYRSTSADLLSWSVPVRVVKRSRSWEFDQVADASVVDRFLYFDGMNNLTHRGSIGVARLSSPRPTA